MYEKVSKSHPDKIADRIAGAIVDLAYKEQEDPRIAVEVLIGHGRCLIIAETSVGLDLNDVFDAVHRIAGDVKTEYKEVRQDPHLAENQAHGIRCGDNGIFKGMPVTEEQAKLAKIAREIYAKYPTDGKYIICEKNDFLTKVERILDSANIRYASTADLIICQSNAKTEELKKMYPRAIVNPLGDWTGGTDVDTGATNRKLGSDMADSVTGGGLHGKDLSKADVSVNIYAWLKAQETGQPVELFCAIGDETVDGKPYSEIVEIARDFIRKKGGFEKFAEWGLI